MKKISDLLKPFLSVIFGALLLLCHFNLLSSSGAYLALGIVGVTLAAYFVTIGLLGVLLGTRFSSKAKRVLDGCGLISYPLFLGACFLIDLILSVKANVGIGPMGWTLAIYSTGVSIALGVFLIITYFSKKHKLLNVTFIFSCLFALSLLLDVLMINGNPAPLGSIIVLVVVLYGVYLGMLFGVLKDLEKAQKKASKEIEKPEEVKSK